MTIPVLALAKATPVVLPPWRLARSARGARAHLGGMSAEEAVARHYARRGLQVAARRWRGSGGEIDLILRDGADLVFVEVKAAQTLAVAASRLTRRQMDRICLSALDFLKGEPRGLLTAMRFDLATVDRQGVIDILPNAFGET